FLVSFSLAILAGLGASHVIGWDKLQDFKATKRIQQALLGLTITCMIFAGAIFIAWLGNNADYDKFIRPAALTAIIAAATFFLIPRLLDHPKAILWPGLVVGLLVFDLFAVSMDNSNNFDHVPPAQQLSMTPPPLVAQALSDTDVPFRVDGYRALYDNYGSLYDLADMRGISPLFLDGPFELQQGDLINPRAWELVAVRYVYTDWTQLPVASTIIGSGQDRYGAVNMHRLSDPRPFAFLMTNTQIVPDDEQALKMAEDTGFNPRQTIILNEAPKLDLSAALPSDAQATVTEFKPEAFTVHVNTSANAILSLAHPYYPGWQATLDDQPTNILKAYGAFSAVEVPAGDHTIQLRYNPLSYRIGVILSLITWG